VNPIHRLLCRASTAREGELPTLLLGLGYGFAIFASYSILKPLRDALALEGGVRDLPWLFTGTLLAIMAAHPLYTWLVANWSRQRFVAATSRIAGVNLVAFLSMALILGDGAEMVWLGRVFYIWTSVFNLFVVSVFWSLMADVFPPEAARRLFGFLAMGITLGGMIGSGVVSIAASLVNPVWLLVGSILLLETAARLAVALCRRPRGFLPAPWSPIRSRSAAASWTACGRWRRRHT
jgi:AAA family ATP:ADP antiporter